MASLYSKSICVHERGPPPPELERAGFKKDRKIWRPTGTGWAPDVGHWRGLQGVAQDMPTCRMSLCAQFIYLRLKLRAVGTGNDIARRDLVHLSICQLHWLT